MGTGRGGNFEKWIGKKQFLCSNFLSMLSNKILKIPTTTRNQTYCPCLDYWLLSELTEFNRKWQQTYLLTTLPFEYFNLTKHLRHMGAREGGPGQNIYVIIIFVHFRSDTASTLQNEIGDTFRNHCNSFNPLSESPLKGDRELAVSHFLFSLSLSRLMRWSPFTPMAREPQFHQVK